MSRVGLLTLVRSILAENKPKTPQSQEEQTERQLLFDNSFFKTKRGEFSYVFNGTAYVSSAMGETHE
jgi:hypothetical protein